MMTTKAVCASVLSVGLALCPASTFAQSKQGNQSGYNVNLGFSSDAAGKHGNNAPSLTASANSPARNTQATANGTTTHRGTNKRPCKYEC